MDENLDQKLLFFKPGHAWTVAILSLSLGKLYIYIYIYIAQRDQQIRQISAKREKGVVWRQTIYAAAKIQTFLCKICTLTQCNKGVRALSLIADDRHTAL